MNRLHNLPISRRLWLTLAHSRAEAAESSRSSSQHLKQLAEELNRQFRV